MCEVKTVIFLEALLLEAIGFCINQVSLEEKLGHHREIINESPCEKEYNKYCLNGGECHYLADKDIL